ncbi:virulence factor TspB C-terminal domain-related protein [Pseudomonas sp. PDM33]|uniref:virulence factor TspB C-terminal domain-related protein n=1 Tax=Pseudomonas sp. PDM33 TaxID=2854765 RepID=UPI00210BECCE|nr:virulence factor TspB C-terminal domain-related protein [Pseudomonas sp. PDM33]
MGRYLALLLVLIAGPALATERVKVDPFIKAGPGYSAANGSITGYVPSKSNTDLLLEAERKGWMGTSAAKTPVTVKPKVTIPVSGIGSKLKAGLKTNAGQLAMSAAISGAIAGVGWVMSDDNTKIQKKDPGTAPETVNTTDGTYYWKYAPVSNSAASTPLASCVIVGTSVSQPFHGHFVSKVNDTRYTCAYYDQFDRLMGPFSYIDRSGNHCATGYTWDAVTASCLSPEQKKDLTETDWNAIDPWIAAQSAQWLKTLLMDVCGGSYGTVNPQGCYDDLQKQSKAIITGPASVQGPKQTTTGTYNRLDGTLGNTSSTTNTTYNIRYGDTYFDYDTVTTKTTTEDGVTTGEETTSDQGDPQEKPDEEKDKEDEEKPERLASGEPCDVPLSCSGDAIDCAVLTQEKALRCAYEKQSDYEKHEADIKAAVTGAKFEMDDSTEIQIPSFINQGTRFLPASCPADKTFSLRTNGGRTFAVTYEPLCAAATDLGYLIVIAVGAFCVLYVGRSLGGE